MENQSNDKSVIITRKIRLLIDVPSDNKEELSKYYRRLYDWQKIAFKAANIITSHLFIQEQANQLLYFQDDVKRKLVNKEKDDCGILNTSRQNSIYRLIAKKFKTQIPSSIISCLVQKIYLTFCKERSKYFNGERSLSSYKSNLPVPFDSKAIYNLSYCNELKQFKFILFKDPQYVVPFKTYLGKDLSGNKIIIKRCISGDYKLCSSSYIIDNNKIYLLLSVKIPTSVPVLEPKTKVKAALSCYAPIIAIIGKKKIPFGNQEVFLDKRKAIQCGLHRRKKAMKYNTGGRGIEHKTSGIFEFRKKEKRFVENYMHYLSKVLVDFCVKRKAGTLELINLKQNIDEANKDAYIFRNWSYGSLREKIEYKCKQNGIDFIIT